MSTNTGPKGVINDARASAFKEREIGNEKLRERHRQLYSRAATTTTVLDDEAEVIRNRRLSELQVDAIPSNDAVDLYMNSANVLSQEKSDDESLDSELDELMDLDLAGDTKREELSVLQKWRDERLRQLQDMKPTSRGNKYGTLKTVDSDGYLAELEACDSIVVLLLFDESEESRMISWALDKIAQQHATLGFIRMNYGETEIDSSCIPTILAYTDHGNRIIANIIRVIDEIPSTVAVTGAALEAVLKRFGVLQ